MDIGGSLKVLGSGIGWRRLGLGGSGRRLLDALGGSNEQEQVLAGMALVKAGDRSVGLIEEAIDEGRASSKAVLLLADIGGDQARSILASASGSKGPYSEAADEALDLLRRIDDLEDGKYVGRAVITDLAG